MNNQLQNILCSNLDEYRSIPFWSWNSHLEIPVLLQQIRDMKQAGIGGFIMHARTGLADEYMGEHWMNCIGACLEEARKLGMEAWIYDENGWPSGFVGGKLSENEDFRARYLEYEQGDYDPTAFAAFWWDGNTYRRTEQSVPGVAEYHNIYLRISPANTDILNPAVVDAFIRETHEKYYARFAQSFGRELAGFFTDEPQYYRWATPYTPCAEEYFENIRDGLIWLFVQDEQGYPFRIKYYSTLNQLYTENFYKRLYDWCHAHNCRLTGHSVEETTLFSQMWGGASVMPSYEFEDMPGIDSLGRWNTEELATKQVASVAAQLGKKFVLTETYGCAGHDVTPKELRSIGEAQYFQGVNRMCQHLYPYSVAGQGKVDHPPVFGPQGNWGSAFKSFNDYFARLGCLIGNTKETVDIAVLSPVRDVWLNYIRSLDRKSVEDLEREFEYLIGEQLRKNGVTFHLLDETILSRYGVAENDHLRVGQMVYDTVLIPKMQNLMKDTYRLLKAYQGKLCILALPKYIDGTLADVDLVSNITIDEIIQSRHTPFFCGDGRCFMTRRESALGDFLFVKNLSPKNDSTVILENAQQYRILDLQTLTERSAAKEMVVEAENSLILIGSNTPLDGMEINNVRDATKDFTVTDISENYFVMDYAKISKDGVNFGGKYPIPGLFEGLLRENYKGRLTVQQSFIIQEAMPLTLLMEKAKLDGATLNGKTIQFIQSDWDINFQQADISELLQVGENVFCYTFDFWQHDGVQFALFDPEATESLRNCLYYDTSIEPVYLRGNFVVNADMSLSACNKMPPIASRLANHGYPFFMGRMTLQGIVAWDGEGIVKLELDGRFLAAEVIANGKSQELAMDTKGDITHLLCEGENPVRIELYSSLRNLLGPHHYKPDPESKGATPYQFTMQNTWSDGISKDYTHVYHSVPFGTQNIKIIYANCNSKLRAEMI